MREREVTPERLGETGSPDSADERTERVARTCWTIQRRLRKVGEPLGRLDFAGMKITPSPSAFRRFLEQVEEDPAGNMPEEGLVARCDEALRGFERTAGEAVRRIRAVADARRQVERDAWNGTALRTLTKINLPSVAVCGLFGFYAAQRGTGGHDCRQVRGGVAGIG